MSDMIERRAYLAILFDIYGGLLTEKQQNMFDLYHQCDLSLGEIAEEIQISRQAVFDVIKRTEHALEEYEGQLHLAKKEMIRKQRVEQLLTLIDGLELEKNKELIEIQQLIAYLNNE